ncbi:MAG TPA: pyridoxamine 5'-phosphate oxidase family protein [Methylocella sp.]|nr:pyridoxamine 5'-phosphate oxidase family protein [Methylocella sp.]
MVSEPESAAPGGYDALAQAKELLRSVRAGALATIVPASGSPFASLVNVATLPDASPILLMSRLAAHTRHLDADPRLSLLLAKTGPGDPLTHPRITIMGRAACVLEPDARQMLKTRFLAKHPDSALYADFADFSFWRVSMEEAHLNGGFARAAHFKAAALLTPIDGAEELISAEPELLTELNGRRAGEIALLAAGLAGLPPGDWRATGIDPEGMDLALRELTARIAFPRAARTRAGVFELFSLIVEQARQAAGKTA